MEQEEFTSEYLKGYSPRPVQCFQADKFNRRNNHLEIPDTIPEQSSLDFGEKTSKMEDKAVTETSNDDNKNISCVSSAKSDESSASTVIAVENAYLINCEKKLLESSIGDEKSFTSVNKSVDSEFFKEMTRKLGLNDDTISTPTQTLRKQSSMLRTELAEADEFHDLEIQILKEENEINEEVGQTSVELIEKYSALMELYVSLKNEYDEYRKEQENLQYKTADCLETLCSQIEASDSSLNFSGASFVSFNTEIKSSTLMVDPIGEVETTVVNDATVLDQDPLALTQDGTFKTPNHFPLRSAKKLFAQDSTLSTGKSKKERLSNVNEKDKTKERKGTKVLLSDMEIALQEKENKIKLLEERLRIVEELSTNLKNEYDRVGIKKSNGEIISNCVNDFEVIKSYENEIQITKEKLTLVDETVLKLKSQLTALEDEKHELANCCQDLKEGNTNLLSEIISKNNDVKNLEKELEFLKTFKNENEDLKQKLLQTEEIVSDLRKRIDLEEKQGDSKVEELMKEIDSLGKEIQIVKQEKNQNECRIEELLKEITDLGAVIKLADEEKIRSETKITDLVTEIEKLKKDMEQTKEDLEKEIEKSNFEKSENENKLKELMTVIEEFEKEKLNLENIIEIAKHEKTNSDEKVENLLKEIEELRKEIEVEKENKINGDSQIKDLLIEMDELKKEVELSKSETTENENKIKELLNKVDEFDAEKFRLEEVIESAKLEKADSDTRIENLLKEMEELNKKIGDLENLEKGFDFNKKTKEENEELRQKLLQTEEIVSNLKTHEVKVKDLEESNKKLTDALTGIQSSLALPSDSVSKILAGNHDVFNERINGFMKELDDLGAELDLAKKEKSNNECKMNDLVQEIEKLKNDIAVTKEDLEKEIEKSNLEKVENENKLQDLVIEIEEFRKEKVHLEEILEITKQEKDNSEKQVESLLNEVDRLGKEIENMRNLEEDLDFNNKLKGENEDLKQKLLQAENIMSDLRTNVAKVKDLENSNKKLSDILTDIQSCLALPSDTLSNVLSSDHKIFCERINGFMKELGDLGTELDLANEEKTNNECKINDLVQEIEKLKKDMDITKEDLEKEIERSNLEKSENENKILGLVTEIEEFRREKIHLQEILEITKNEKANGEKQIENLINEIDRLGKEIDDLKILEKDVDFNKKFKDENEDLKQKLLQAEEIVSDLKINEVKVKDLEDSNKKLTDILIDVQFCLDLPNDTLSVVLSDNRKIFNERINAFMKELDDLDTELKLAKEEKIKNESKINDLVTEIETLRKDIEESKDHFEKEIEMSNLAKTENENKLKQLITEIEELGNEKFHLKEIIETVQHEKANSDRQVGNLLKEIEELLKEIDVEKENKSNVESQVKELLIEIEELKKEVEMSKSEVTENENKIKELLNKIEVLENLNKINDVKVKDLEDNNKKLTDVLSDIQSGLDLPSDTVSKVLSGNTNELDLCKKIKDENENLKQRLLQTEEIVSDLKIKIDLEKKQGEAKIEELMKETDCMVKEIEIAKEEKNCNECRIEVLLKDIGDLTTVIELANEEKIKTECRINDLVMEIEKLKKDMEQTKEDFEKEIEEYKLEKNENQIKFKELMTEIEELRREKFNLEEKMETFQQVKADSDKQVDKLLKQIEELIREIEFEKENKNKGESQIKELMFEIEGLKNETELSKNEIAENENKIKELLNKVEVLENLNNISEGKVKDLEDNNKIFTNVLTDIQSCLNLPSETVSEVLSGNHKIFSERINYLIKSKIDSLKSENEDKLKELKTDFEELKSEKFHVDEIIEITKQEKAMSDKRVENLLKEIEELGKEIDFEKKNKTNLESQVKELLIEIEELKNKVELSKNEINENENKIKELLNKVEMFENINNINEAKVKDLEDNNKIFTNVLTDIQSCLDLPCETVSKVLSGDRKIFTERINAIEKKFDDLGVELDLANEEKIKSDAKVNDLETEIEKLKHDIEQAKQDLENEIEKSNLEKNENENKIKELMTEIEEFGREKLRLEEILETTKHEKDNSDKQVEKLLKEIEELAKKIDIEKENKNNKESQIKELLIEIERLKKEIEQFKGEINYNEGKIKELLNKVEEFEREKFYFEEIIETIKRQKTNSDEKVENLLKEIEELGKEIQVEKENKNKWESEIKELLIEIEKLKKDVELSKSEIAENENKIKELLNKVEVLENLDKVNEIKVKDFEDNNKKLTDVLSDIQSCLDLPSDTVSKVLSGNRKIFSERINAFLKSKMESLKAENKNLKIGNDHLKEKVKELSIIISESASQVALDMSSLNNSVQPSMSLRSKSRKSTNLCARRLDKLEEINHNLAELITQILSRTDFPNLEKIKLCSVRDYPQINKQVMKHFDKLDSRINDLKAGMTKLDEECDSYANTIKDLKKEAVAVWKANKEKTDSMKSELSRLEEEKTALEKENQELQTRISKLENECQKLKSSSKLEGPPQNCSCGSELKKVTDMKRTLLIKEQKILELQDLENQNALYKSQIKYLENALVQEKKKISEEKEKNKKLQNELSEAAKNQKTENKKSEENVILDELRLRGSFTGGVVQDFVDREKMRKLTKDIEILKELCRARYAEIKRLETENASLKSVTSKNSNQMDSPIRTRAHKTRSKTLAKNVWKSEISGKENSPV